MQIVNNKPPLLKMLDIDMEKFERALLKNVDKGDDAKLEFIRQGRVGMPVVRTEFDHRKQPEIEFVGVATVAEAPHVVGVVSDARLPPVFNFAAGSNVVINMVAPNS